MHKRIGSVALAIAIGFGGTGVALGSVVVTATPAGAASPVVYSAIPSSTAPNYPSVGFEAYQAAEFGDEVGLTGNATPLSTARVLLSTWGCESGNWYSNDCSTTPGSTFSVPITFKVYAVTPGSPDTPGALLGSRTKTFNVPYRPSASPSCTGGDAGKWKSGGSCFNGLSVPISFDFTTGPQVNLPSQVIWTVVYNTSHYGPSPIGEVTSCYVTSGGCGYDSLNVGLTPTNNTGTDTDSDGVFWNSATPGQYCDGGTGGSGTLRDDTGCWTGLVPAGELQLMTAPGAPRNVNAVPGNGNAVVRWMPSVSNGGSAVTQYVVTAVTNGSVQKVQTFGGSATSGKVTGLKNGTPYRFRVAAKNAYGTGIAAVTPSTTTVGAPGAPSQPTASNAGSGSLKVSFKAPATNGAPIKSYTALCVSNHGVNGTKSGKAKTLVVSGLTAGKVYRCRVTATNSRGTGPISAASAPATA